MTSPGTGPPPSRGPPIGHPIGTSIPHGELYGTVQDKCVESYLCSQPGLTKCVDLPSQKNAIFMRFLQILLGNQT